MIVIRTGPSMTSIHFWQRWDCIQASVHSIPLHRDKYANELTFTGDHFACEGEGSQMLCA